MIVDKAELHNGIWYEDKDGNYIPWNGKPNDPPENAETKHVWSPIVIEKKIYKVGDSKPMMDKYTMVSNTGQDVIVSMITSGDYTLSEALALYFTACERCRNVLKWKYTNKTKGYPEFGEEWKRVHTSCRFCKRGEKE